MSDPVPQRAPWQRWLHEVIFEADTPLGRFFDYALLVAIILSVASVMLESVASIDREHHAGLVAAEWVFTVLFTIEYVLRLLSVRRPASYALSFFGIVDLLAILPTYLSLFFPGAQTLLVIRALRLLRIFRILKLARFLSEAAALRKALWQSRAKITVFLATVVILVTVIGAAMHLVEGRPDPANPEIAINAGFDSIPKSMYWAIVTMTTVGYGDVAPITLVGKILASAIMILGYCLIIVPTGIITAELASGGLGRPISTQHCPDCSREGHEPDARHCKYCGGKL